MKIIGTVVFLILLPFSTFAADLFIEGKIRAIKSGDPVTAEDNIGGFAIYQGEGGWKFDKSYESTSTGGRFDGNQAKMGSVRMGQWFNDTLLAYQVVSATLTVAGGSYWGGTPCAPGHLVAVNRPRGRDDHCMTIDPVPFTAGDKNITMLSIKLTNSSGGRYLNSDLLVNPDLLGIKGTGVGDWTIESVQSQPYKKEFMDRLAAWSEMLFDRSVKAFDYSQPKDAYADMPSIYTLVPVYAAFPSTKFSRSFLSTLEDIKHRSNMKAVAFSPETVRRTPHGYSWGDSTQADADKKALASCELRLSSTSLPCRLVNFAEVGIASPVGSMPPALTPPENSLPIEAKLEKLKALKFKGLISADQYEKQVAEVLQKM